MSDAHIILNGKQHEIADIHTVAELLQSLGTSGKPVIVELDGEALLPAEFAGAELKDGSRVEIVSIVAGG